jgi:lysophospholipase L1-like esterase
MIDVINGGISGQAAPDELLRLQSDLFDEKPALVIWQVGTNAIFGDLEDGADSHLHTGVWATNCVSKAFGDAIAPAAAAVGIT